MAQLKARPRKTVHDYMKLPEGVRAELIEGEILMSPSPKTRHQRIIANTYRALFRAVEQNELGRVLLSPLDVHLPSGDVVQPDVVVVLKMNEHIVKDWIRGVPDLLVEVISPDSPERDRFTKRNLYARNGVKEYWLVDDETRSVEVLALAGTVYAPSGYFLEADTVNSPLIAGPALPVREVFG